MSNSTIARTGIADRLTALFWRRPNVLLALLLAPPLVWLGLVYVGSLFALLWQSLYSIDEFSGVVKQEFTLKTFGELLLPQNYDIIVRTVTMAAAVTLASVVLAFPVAFFAARFAKGRWKAVFYLGIMLPLWSSYLVKGYA
ncbi:MAG: ABC transporter permease, partial [Rhodobacteraceae bacterium]|nr:ABC transporter permease [Paracoccaceae bacterium]